MSGAVLNLDTDATELRCGAYWSLTVRFYQRVDGVKTPKDLSGYEFRMQVRKLAGSDLLLDLVSEGETAASDAVATGTIELSVSSLADDEGAVNQVACTVLTAQSGLVAAGNYQYTLAAVVDDEEVVELLRGKLKASRTIVNREG
jgi:hypothetical protein